MPVAYKVTIRGYFYSLELYDNKGKSVYTLEDAIDTAEDIYGKDWEEVYNGEHGANRLDLLEQSIQNSI